MDIAEATAQDPAGRAIVNREGLFPADWSAGEPPAKPVRAHEILSAIINHQAVPSTLQMVADTFVSLCPSKGVAIFVLSGGRLQVEAEAGLPRRPPGSLLPKPIASLATALVASSLQEFAAADSTSLGQILNSGVTLRLALPLTSGSGEPRGAFTVFDLQPDPLDETTRQTIQSLCDLARLAIEHGLLYEQVAHGRQIDWLTGLPNRPMLADRLRQGMVIAQRQSELLAACCIGLDRFQQINDGLGHELGDTFLKMIGERLSQSIRERDMLARHGGDQFLLVLRDLKDASDAVHICQRLLHDVRKPFLLEGHSVTINASIGIGVFPDHGNTAELLLRHTDVALQAAKRAGGGRAEIYSPALGLQSQRAAEMAGALLDALAKSQFRIMYQPIFTTEGEIIAFEALLRWHHPTWGPVSPTEFIPTAEKSGLIVPIGDWVIDEVCRQALEWSAAHLPPIKMFANVSGVQLERPDFSAKIARALKQSGLAPDRLELEITESWVISDLRGAAGKLQQLRDLGIGVALDDFGTGYAAFDYLQELPLDTLKIDRSFIQHLDRPGANPSTVRAMMILARQLGLRTVAEGVESEEQVRKLAAMGCDLMQGFLLGRPLQPEAARLLLRNQKRPAPLLREAAKGVSPLASTECLIG
ncbi:MAG: bifunctional diguanylate cyclase/phosphodiesterase [Acidobacteriaceae bacterium]